MNRGPVEFEERQNTYIFRSEVPEVVIEVDFVAPCPVHDCLHENRVIVWKHHNCGGKEKLNDKGELRCLKCFAKGRFVDWKFRCKNHDFKKASSQGVAHALSIMAQLAISEDQQQFISKTCKIIMEQILEEM